MCLKYIILLFFLINIKKSESSSLIEKSYDYVLNLGKSLAPNLMTFVECFTEEDPWICTKEKATKLLNTWEEENEKQRRNWKEAADQEAVTLGRSSDSELPSKLGTEVENSLKSLADVVQNGVARAFGRKHGGGGIDAITISTSDKKKDKKKHKPQKIHLIQSPMFQHMKHVKHAKGRGFQQTGKSPVQSWVIGFEEKENEKNVDLPKEDHRVDVKGRGLLESAWSLGEKAIDAVAEHAIEAENSDNEISLDKSSLEEQRGKKKKKKKAILKLLILGAVLKAKIATLLQILSFKLQVKFFLIALIGLGINLARFWLDLKKTHQQPPKVIYYEHAQHQHHYDHEDEHEHGWGPWARSVDPEELLNDPEFASQNGPYKSYDRSSQPVIKPVYSSK